MFFYFRFISTLDKSSQEVIAALQSFQPDIMIPPNANCPDSFGSVDRVGSLIAASLRIWLRYPSRVVDLSEVRQSFNGENRLTRTIKDVATLTCRPRMALSSHFDIRPEQSISPADPAEGEN